uniref:Uncharacterized protein n=1 Tax=Athene cunicularia TaxID=194338 RepID=A0A663ND81_ATHCN
MFLAQEVTRLSFYISDKGADIKSEFLKPHPLPRSQLHPITILPPTPAAPLHPTVSEIIWGVFHTDPLRACGSLNILTHTGVFGPCRRSWGQKWLSGLLLAAMHSPPVPARVPWGWSQALS